MTPREFNQAIMRDITIWTNLYFARLPDSRLLVCSYTVTQLYVCPHTTIVDNMLKTVVLSRMGGNLGFYHTRNENFVEV